MKTVFIVSAGEMHEGSHIVSVHRTKKEAVKAALAVKTCFEGGWVLDGEDEWINGCDFVVVREEEVKK
jgi:hypothetical protein